MGKLRGRGGKMLLKHKRQVSSLRLSPDRNLIGSADWMGDIYVWELWEKTPRLHISNAHQDRAQAVAFCDDQRRVVSCGFDGCIRVWDLASQKLVQEQAFPNERFWSLSTSEDGAWLAVESFAVSGYSSRLWQLKNGSVDFSKTYEHPGNTVFVPASDLLCAVHEGQLLIKAQEKVRASVALAGAALPACDPLGRYVTVAQLEDPRALRVFRVSDGTLVHDIELGSKWTNPCALALSPNADFIAALRGPMLQMWSTQTKEQLLPEGWTHTDFGSSIAFASSNTLVTSGWDRAVRLWDLDAIEGSK